MLLKWTKTSSPSGETMKPNPFFESNHLTGPRGMTVLPNREMRRATAGRGQRSRRAMTCAARARPGVLPAANELPTTRAFDDVVVVVRHSVLRDTRSDLPIPPAPHGLP